MRIGRSWNRRDVCPGCGGHLVRTDAGGIASHRPPPGVFCDGDKREPCMKPERFWSRVGEPDSRGCRVWLGAKNTHGYGKVRVDGALLATHRVALELHTGRVCPEGMNVLHACDNPPCCEPAHLRWGTLTENAADRVTRGRCNHPRGEQHYAAKLTAAQVVELRAATGTNVALAAQYGVSAGHVGLIRSGQRWGLIAIPTVPAGNSQETHRAGAAAVADPSSSGEGT